MADGQQPTQAELHLSTAHALLDSPIATPLQLAALQRAILSDRRPFYNNFGTGLQSFFGLNDKWRFYEGEIESYTAFARRLGDNWQGVRNAPKVVELGKRLLKGVINEEDPAILADALKFITGTLYEGFVAPPIAAATYARDSIYEAGGALKQLASNAADKARDTAQAGIGLVAALAIAGVAVALLTRKGN